MKAAGVSVLLDDRKVGPGFMFADADLISAPVRIIVSPRNLADGKVELKYRLIESLSEDAELTEALPTESVPEAAAEKAKAALAALWARIPKP